MTLNAGLVLLLVLGASYASNAARDSTNARTSFVDIIVPDDSVLQINRHTYEGNALKKVSGKGNMCTMCEELVTEVLDYLEDNSTQTMIIDILQQTCSELSPIEKQCTTLVDYYVPFIFSEISSVQPEAFCQYIDLCKEESTTLPKKHEDKCEICHQTMAEVLLKLKDPDTELEIIELLLKACNSVEDRKRVRKCKTLVFEYGPLILENAQKLLEKLDLCTAIHACNSHSSSSTQEYAHSAS